MRKDLWKVVIVDIDGHTLEALKFGIRPNNLEIDDLEKGAIIARIAERLLTRVPKEAAKEARTFVMSRRDLLTRSNRAPRRGEAWIFREQPAKYQVTDTSLWREIEYTPVGRVSNTSRRGGRWEDEVWTKLPSADLVIAVMHTAHELRLEFDEHYMGHQRCSKILPKFGQHCQRLMPGILFKQLLWAGFPSFPELAAFDLSSVEHSIQLEPNCVVKRTTHLSSYRLVSAPSNHLLDLNLAQHDTKIVEVDLDVMEFCMTQAWELLASTSSLQSNRITAVRIDGSKSEVLPDRASRVLDQLSLGFRLDGHERDLEHRGVGPAASFEARVC
ncbi:hypothetical protein BGZ82_000891 [Podila clonocystis]|nr:hypothetical protein BGZ82_000891 [Podila clonocystis]